MNLLIDNWIPVRPRNGGKVQILNLQSLYCSRDQWRLSLPRDDMELAALALLVCIAQIIAPAKDDVEFRHRIMNPLTEDEFQRLIAPWIDMFYLNHAEHPFMQTKGVKANDVTPMEKLLAGVSGATNCAFVNQPGRVKHYVVDALRLRYSTRRIRHLVLVVALKAVYVEEHL